MTSPPSRLASRTAAAMTAVLSSTEALSPLAISRLAIPHDPATRTMQRKPMCVVEDSTI